MRQIKFRAWYKNEKLILPIAEITFHKDGDILAFPLTREAISSYLVGGNVVLMQFTGLLDKDGKEIYEGDILESTRPAKEKYLVVWDKEDAAFYAKDEHFGSRWKIPNNGKCVVIGNIHENPELINR